MLITHTRFRQFLAALVLIGLCCLCATNPAGAQESGASKRRVLYEKVLVREAVRKMFRSLNVDYTLSPQIQGDVFVPIDSQGTFETELQDLMNQIHATYRIEGGIYEILPRENDDHLLRDKSAVTVDSDYIYVVKDLTVYKLRKSDLSFVSKATLPGP